MNKKLLVPIFLCFFVFLFFIPLFGQWAKAYGGNAQEYRASIQQTSDGGYIVAGNTGTYGSYDYWVLKLDSTGAIEWHKTYGGSSDDTVYSIQETNDGGYIVAGYTNSFGAGDYDIWILKLDSTGAIEWQRTYGGSTDDRAYSIQQTSDGGYIVAGWTNSFGGYYNYWVLKLDSTGTIGWQKTYGGSGGDEAYSIQQTSDGGYIVAGHADSFGAGDLDIWILKLSSNGAAEWQQTYAGSADDRAYSIQQTSDGGYIVAGTTGSFGAGSFDYWVLKLDSTGAIEWQRTYGGSDKDRAWSIQQTNDGGYVIAGESSIFLTSKDFFILKLNSDGDIHSSCGFIGSSDAIVTNTIVSPENTNITSQATSVIQPLTNISPQDPYLNVNVFCPKYTLTISTNIGGTTIPEPDSYIYLVGTEVTITAIPDTSYRFGEWTGDVPQGHENDNPITITMDSDKSIEANFIRQYTLTIKRGVGGTTDSAPGTYIHDSGTYVSIRAIPYSGYRFSGWSGDASGTTNPITITMESDKTIIAYFSLISEEGDDNSGLCFIATAAYGSPLHPYVKTLRDFRDKYLVPRRFGCKFVDLYYKYSPFVANIIAKHMPLRVIVQINLTPFIVFCYSMVHLGPIVTGGILLLILVLPIFFMSVLRRR